MESSPLKVIHLGFHQAINKLMTDKMHKMYLNILAS